MELNKFSKILLLPNFKNDGFDFKIVEMIIN